MWLFGGTSSPEVSDEAEALKEEAEDLRLKLEALRMAEYREAQRAACGRGHEPASMEDDHESSIERSTSGQERSNDDLEAMYDFTKFVSTESNAQGHSRDTDQQSPQVTHLDDAGTESEDEADEEDDDSECIDLESLRLIEAKLRQRQEALQLQAAEKEKKLTVASRALEKTRAQMRQLTDQLEMKEQCGSKSNTQADALQRLLAEKDRRLEVAAQEAASAMRRVDEDCPTQQPQEAPSLAKDEKEEQLLQLAAMTEELTDALDDARDREEETRRQLVTANERLKEEWDRRSLFERELAVVRQQQASEVAALRKRLQEQERSLASERARLKQLEARPKFFDFDVIKKAPVEFPDIVV